VLVVCRDSPHQLTYDTPPVRTVSHKQRRNTTNYCTMQPLLSSLHTRETKKKYLHIHFFFFKKKSSHVARTLISIGVDFSQPKSCQRVDNHGLCLTMGIDRLFTYAT